jgi:hypothetical protein
MRGDTKETFPGWFEDESYIDDERVGSVCSICCQSGLYRRTTTTLNR